MSLAIRVVAVVVVATFTLVAQARELTFEDRVAAQEAIERVYYSHQLGATKPFEEAVPREVLERKVTTYLKQSVALEKFWHTPVTAEMLRRELERMARGTRMPERLRELFAALGDDPVLIHECLARATLADRLTRNFHAFDARFHETARREVDALREALTNRTLDPWNDHPRRTEVEIVEEADDGGSVARRGGETAETSNETTVSPAEFARWRERLPDLPGEVRSVDEDREAFHLRVLLEGDASRLRVAAYRVEKTPWDAWWGEIASGLDETAVAAAASADAAVPDATGGRGVEWDPENWQAGAEGAGGPCAGDDTWDNRSLDDVPDPRAYHTAVWTGSLMVVWGGYGIGDFLNTGGRYDPATDTWSSTSTAGAPSGRYLHTAVWTGSLMVVWGGSGWGGSDYISFNTGGRYDPATDTWSSTSTAGAPPGRWNHTAVWTGSLMVVWGGESGVYLNTGGRYDPATDTWRPTSTAGAPSGRYLHTAVWTGSLMVVWGGESGAYLNTGGRYDPATDTWSPTSTAGAPSGRRNHTAVWTGSRMVVWGGESGVYLNTGGRYDPATDTWSPTSTAGAPSVRSSHTAVWTGSRMVVWGGGTSVYNPSTNTGGRYDPATDTWSPTSTAGAPSGRVYHTAVWTGSLMVVWGGDGNTGGRYDPATDMWSPTSIAGAPSGRYGHTAVWTGSLMVVWGGYGSGGVYLNTGGRYDPATDTWSPTSTAGAPSGRKDNTAVWTGSLMVVWGGEGPGSGGGYLNTGGRYDPATDTWSPTSIAGAPSWRRYHTAVWTGSLMVVWGGYRYAGPLPGYLNTGGRYDPATDTWSPTSTAGAPSVRRYHTAVWTGSLMVVWGGESGAYLNTGGRYDPSTDTWSPTSTAGAPSGRRYHSAVWTVSLMVVWGGEASYANPNLNTGGRYDPSTDTWSPTSTAGAPSGRQGHTAVWTGSRMIVWGELGGYTNTGGRYDPSTDTWSPTSTAGAPSGRDSHTAVWTGSLMVVWGGSGFGNLNTGGRYVLGHSVDDDGDGYTECAGDCNDGNAAIRPGALELCDGLDNDCSGAADEPFNLDGDAFRTCAGDCNDADPHVYPGAPERCDFVDNQCPGNPGFGQVDEGFDADGDGFPVCQGDCDVTNDTVFPNAPEECDNVDNQCPGDEGYGLTDEGNECASFTEYVCDGFDENGNGYVDEGCDNDNDDYCDGSLVVLTPDACPKGGGDCRDLDPRLHPDNDYDLDGLEDCEEDRGIDVDGNGSDDLGIVAAGADPLVPDIFIEIDYMSCAKGVIAGEDPALCDHGHAPHIPEPSALAAVREAFQSQGINLHTSASGEWEAVPEKAVIDTSSPYLADLNMYQYGVPTADADASSVCDHPYDAYFGSFRDRCATPQDGCEDQADRDRCLAIMEARSRLYRYALLVHRIAGGESGHARTWVDGSCASTGFVISLDAVAGHANWAANRWRDLGGEPDETGEYVDYLAGTFMHELGHTLGLLHGGGDGVNCKPNYLSVMSHARQFNAIGRDADIKRDCRDGVPMRVDRALDYSRERLLPLNEGGLLEPVGISGPPQYLTMVGHSRTAFGSGNACPGRKILIGRTSGAIDWDYDGDMDDPAAEEDVNDLDIRDCQGDNGGSQDLQGFDDWKRVWDGVTGQTCIRLPSGTVEQDVGDFRTTQEFGAELTVNDYLDLVLGGDDVDDDGILNAEDVCPLQADALQKNVDGDDRGDACDCLSLDGDRWATPSEARLLRFTSAETLEWLAPVFLGCVTPVYDLLRSVTATDFVVNVKCLETAIGPGSTAEDLDVPATGEVFFYLMRAVSGCPEGAGPLGKDSFGNQRVGVDCR